MKKIVTILTVLLVSTIASAQYYMLSVPNAGHNPGGLNTDGDDVSVYAADSEYKTVFGPGSNNWSTGQSLPFAFTFNNKIYAAIYVAPTGIVSFTSTKGAAPEANEALPSALIPDNSICAWGLNLSGTNDGVFVKTHGTRPNRQYWITWGSASWTEGAGWAYWSIVLEETTNAVYIVDARNYVGSGSGISLTAGLQFDATNAMSVLGSPALGGLNEATGGDEVGSADNSYYAFKVGVQPGFDVTMNGLYLPKYAEQGQEQPITAKLTNLGSETITSLELSYSINGGAPVTESLNGLNIAPGISQEVTHPMSWTPSEDGDVSIDLWASKINGDVDAESSNDKATASTYAYSDSYERTVLYEMFTSSTCPPCVGGNENFENVVSKFPENEFASVKYQMSWPGAGDPYTTEDGLIKRNLYQISSVPALQINGGWNGNSNDFISSLHDDAIEIPAFVSVWAQYTISVVDQKVTTCAIIESKRDVGTVKMHIAIKENRTIANVGTNGEREFFDVLKRMVPDANGQDINITKGMREEICEEYTFKGSYRLPANAGNIINDDIEHSVEDFNNLEVVVWLQDDDKLVLNAINAISAPLSVKAMKSSNNVSVYPNPAVNNATVSIDASASNNAEIKVVDVVGKVVLALNEVSLTKGNNRIDLNTANLNSGVYFVQVSVNDKVSISQLVIQK